MYIFFLLWFTSAAGTHTRCWKLRPFKKLIHFLIARSKWKTIQSRPYSTVTLRIEWDKRTFRASAGGGGRRGTLALARDDNAVWQRLKVRSAQTGVLIKAARSLTNLSHTYLLTYSYFQSCRSFLQNVGLNNEYRYQNRENHKRSLINYLLTFCLSMAQRAPEFFNPQRGRVFKKISRD